MAVPIVGFPIVTAMIRGIGVVVSVLVLIWAFHFRGGLSLSSNNKDFIFNVHPVLLVISLILLNAMLAYRTVSGTKNFRKAVHLAIQSLAFCLSVIGVWLLISFTMRRVLTISTVCIHGWVLLVYSYLDPVGCWFFNLLVSRWFNKQQSCSASLACILWGLHICTCSWHCCYRNSGETTFLQTNHVISHYSSEAMLVNFMGILIIVLGGCVILAVITPMNDKKDGYRPLDYELQLSTV